MARPYSLDVRERVLRELLSGETIRSIAARFSVSPSFVSKLGTRYHERGSIAPDRQGGDRWSHLIEAHADWLLARLEETPDVTLRELRDGLADRGLETSVNAVHNFTHRHDLSFKKRLGMLQSKSGQT